jgi:homoserine kinase
VKITVRAPATVANLGPGFDCFGMALDLWNEVTVDTDAPPGVAVEGEGSNELPADRSNLVVRAMAAAAGTELPPVAVRCVNRIPLGRGLGSSGAAVVAGMVAAQRLLERDADPEALLELAVGFEGHADNAAAALFGGITLAYRTATGWAAEPVRPDPTLRPVVLIPEHRTDTSAARKALPERVPLADAAFNAGRAALLVRALTGSPSLLGEALQDRLHQRVRLDLAPASRDLFDRLRAERVPVCVAGSGPSLLAFELEPGSVPDPGPGWRAERLAVAASGALASESWEG